LQNAVLLRLRQIGPNFGQAPTNGQTSFTNPYELQLYINEGYTNFLSETQTFPTFALKVPFTTQANVTNYSLNPVPPFKGTVNPVALRVYEFTYTPLNSQERRIPFVSTHKFRNITGQYLNRLGVYSAWPLYVTQLFDRQLIDMWPGTATAGDTIQLTMLPNPSLTGTTCVASAGGALVNPTDIPLLPIQFHPNIVDWVVWQLGQMSDNITAAQNAQASYENGVQKALEYGSNHGEGDSENHVIDRFGTGFDSWLGG
jgi:hypothetical protein